MEVSNRIIKFRAWNTKDKKMYHIDDKHLLVMGRQNNWSFGKPCYDWFMEVTDETNGILMQYTGLKDAGGLTEIYEGDIIDENGLVKGNIYEITEMDKRETDTVIQGFGTKDWCKTYRRAILCGCKDSE